MSLRETPDGKGLVVDADLFNRIARQANKVNNLNAGRDTLAVDTPGGPQIASVDRQRLFAEPATAVNVLNDGDTPIPAFSVAEITGSLETTEAALLDARTLTVKLPTAAAQRIVVTRDAIGKGQAGVAYIAGVCLVTLRRWFASELLNRADAFADEAYALANVNGRLEILWEEREQNDSMMVDTDHLAVVRFVDDYRPFPFINGGSVSVSLGRPLVAANGTGTLDGKLYLKRPGTGQDDAETVHVCVGGTVGPGEEGRAVFAGMPFMAQLDQSVVANDEDSLGTEEDESTFMKGRVGFLPVAYLGTHGGSSWGVLHSHFFRGLINCTARNVVKEAFPNDIHDDEGLITSAAPDPEDNEEYCFLHFWRKVPLGVLRALAPNGNPGLAFNLAAPNDDGAVSGVQMTVGIGVVTSEDWDPETLNWNNKPAVSFNDHIFTLDIACAEELENTNDFNDADITLMYNRALLDLLAIPAPAGTAYGIAVRISYVIGGEQLGIGSEKATIELTIAGDSKQSSITALSSYGIST